MDKTVLEENMKKGFRYAVTVFVTVIVLMLTGCSGSEEVEEHYCEFCGQYFSSGGSISITNDGTEIALCSECMSKFTRYIMKEKKSSNS